MCKTNSSYFTCNIGVKEGFYLFTPICQYSNYFMEYISDRWSELPFTSHELTEIGDIKKYFHLFYLLYAAKLL